MPHQLDFTIAEDAKALGIILSKDHANRDIPNWSSDAMRYFKEFLEQIGSRAFMAEEVRAFAKSNGLVDAPSARAWGGVIIRAKGTGLIIFKGTKQTSNPTARRCFAGLWQKA